MSPPITAGIAGSFTALQPDGKILADNATVRFNADGTLDTSYHLASSDSDGAVGVNAAGRIFILSGIQARTNLLSVYNPDGSQISSQPWELALDYNGHFLPEPNGQVLLWSDGGISIGGVKRNGIARLNADGSLDPSFDPGLGASTGEIETVGLQADGKLLVGGIFSAFDGTPDNGLVRLNSDGTVDPTFSFPLLPTTPNGQPLPTRVFPLPSGQILVWIDGPRTLLLLNSDGSIAANLGGTLGGDGDEIYTLALQPNGKILVGGGFVSFGNQFISNLVRLNADGAIDPSFNAGAALANLRSGPIMNLAVQSDGHVLFSGQDQVNALIRLNADGTADTAFFSGTPAPGQVVATGKTPDSRTLIAGPFLAANGTARSGLARLNEDGSTDLSFVPSGGVQWLTPASAQVTAAADGTVWLAGNFTAIGNQARPGIAHFLADGTLDPNVAPTLSAGGTVSTVTTLSDGRAVIGGSFSSLNGSPRANLAAFGAGGLIDPVLGVADGTNGPVTQLVARTGNGLVLGGNFSVAGSLRRNNLAALNSDGTVDPSFSSSAVAAVPNGLAILPDGRLLVAFPSQSNASGSLLRLTTAGATDLVYTLPNLLGPEFANAAVTALAVDGSGRATLALTENVAPFNQSGMEIFQTTSYHLTRLDAAGNVDTSFPAGLTLPVPALTLAAGADGATVVGGTFTQAGNGPVDGLLLIPSSSNYATGIPPVIAPTSQPRVTTLTAGSAATVSVNAVGSGLQFQWLLNGTAIPGATAATYTIPTVGTVDAGPYMVRVANATGSIQTETDVLTVSSSSWLSNLSARAFVQTQANALFAGFVLTGSSAKLMVIRGVGPELAKSFGVANALLDPQLTFVGPTGSILSQTVGWAPNLAAAAATVYAFPLTPGSGDDAISPPLAPGTYSAQISSVSGQSGVALAEVYDYMLGDPTERLANLSGRAFVGTGANILIGGFVVGGATSETVMIRGVGPELARTFGVPGALSSPQLVLYDSTGAVIAANSGWSTAPTAGPSAVKTGVEAASAAEMLRAGAFPLPAGSADAALIVTLPPGAYSAELSGVGSNTGVGLVEIYEIR